MWRLMLAFKSFFAVLFDGAAAKAVERALSGEQIAQPEPAQVDRKKTEASPQPSKPAPPKRSEALTLLATLQREARFVDFVQEALDAYSDEQVGAAAREVHRDCRQTLQRIFAIAPLMEEEENASIEVPTGFDAGCYRLTGNVSGEPPYNGRLVHHGWKATSCQLPTWTGSDKAALAISPAEVELG